MSSRAGGRLGGSGGSAGKIPQWDPVLEPNKVQSRIKGAGAGNYIIVNNATITNIDNVPAGTAKNTIIYFNEVVGWEICSASDSQQTYKGTFDTPVILQSTYPAANQNIGSTADVLSTGTKWFVNTSYVWSNSGRSGDLSSLKIANFLSEFNTPTAKSAAAANIDVYQKSAINTLLDGKISKISNPVANQIPIMDADGKLFKSNKLVSDFEPVITTKNTAFNKNYSANLADIKSNGNASLGTNDTLPRSDHVHPSDTTKADLAYVNTQLNTKANSSDIATLAQQAVINNGVASTTQTYSSTIIEERLANLPQGGGSGISYYLGNTASDISTYNVLENAPIATTGTLTATANNNQVLLKSFATAILNRTLLNSGFWEFNFACSIDSNPTASKVSNLVIELYTRDGATETLLNSVTTEAITSTSKIEINAIISQQQVIITATTRIVIKIFAKTTEAKNVFFTLFYGGTDSHIHTPFKLTKADIGLSSVENIDTTKASNVAIDGTFLSSNTAIVTGDNLKTVSQKTQGQIEALQSGKQNALAVVDTARIDLTLSGSNLSADIIAGSIGTTQLADNAVTTSKILDNNVTDQKIATGVSSAKIQQTTFTDNTNALVNGEPLNESLNKIQYQAKDALHKNTTNEINNLTAKTSIIDTDVILAENSANVFSKIKISFLNIWSYIKSKDSNVKNWYVSTTGDDNNSGYSPNNAFATLNKATTSLGNTGEALIWLLGQFSTNVTFNQLNVDIKGDNSNKGAATGTSGAVTSSNASSSQRYSNLAFGAFTKTGAGQAYLENVNITGTLNDTSAGYLKYKNGSIGNLSITGTGIKVFEDFELNGTIAINNSSVSVSFNGVGRAMTLSSTSAISLTAGTLSIRNMIIYCPANTVFGASGVNFLCDNVQFINPDTGLAQVITIPSGVNYSLQNCEYDPTSTINGTDISSTRIKRFGNIFAKIIEITSATIDTLIVKGKTFSLNNVTSPTNANADGSGIVVKGATDKTFAYNNTLQSFQSSENISVPSDKDFYIGNTKYADTTKTLTQTTFTLDGNNGNVLNGIKNANIAPDATIDATKVGDGTVNNTRFSYINTLASDAQTQLNNKQPISSTLTTLAGTVNPVTLTKFGATNLTSADSGKIPQVDSNGNIIFNTPASGGNVSSNLSNASGKMLIAGNETGTNLLTAETNEARLTALKQIKSLPVFTTTEINAITTWVDGDVVYDLTKELALERISGSWVAVENFLQAISINNTTINTKAKTVIVTPNAEPSAFLVQLYSAATTPNAKVIVKLCKDAEMSRSNYGCTIMVPGGTTIDGTSQYVLVGNEDFVELIADGTNWRVVRKPTGLRLISTNTTNNLSSGQNALAPYIFNQKYTRYEITIDCIVGTSSGSYTNGIKMMQGSVIDTETNKYIHFTGYGSASSLNMNISGPALQNQWGGGSTSFFDFTGTGVNRSSIKFNIEGANVADYTRVFDINGPYTRNATQFSGFGAASNISTSVFNGLAYIVNGGSGVSVTITTKVYCD